MALMEAGKLENYKDMKYLPWVGEIKFCSMTKKKLVNDKVIDLPDKSLSRLIIINVIIIIIK